MQDRLAEPWQRRARRRAERDARIRELAIAYYPVTSGRTMATGIASELRRYASSGWRVERHDAPPEEPRRRLLFAILRLNAGKLLSETALRYALAGAGQKSNRKLATRRRIRFPERATAEEGPDASRGGKGAKTRSR